MPAMNAESSHPFDRLVPDFIVAAVESLGMRSDGRLLALNSYENRVYQVGVEDADPVVVKFYRPDRWSREAILEEHAFALELQQAEIPVVAPMCVAEQSLFERDDFTFAVYPRQGGRWPELGCREDRQWLGRFLGRIHVVGRRTRFQHRVQLDPISGAEDVQEFLLNEGWIPPHLEVAYETVTNDLITRMADQWDAAGNVPFLRLHGDCHLGNVLWVEGQGPHFVDLDDAMMGPAIQDLWMLLSGSQEEQSLQLREFLEGYRQFSDVGYHELTLIETLRTYRQMHYAAWLAHRWDDPAFPRAFPWFGESRYWEQHVLDLREQMAALDEPMLDV